MKPCINSFWLKIIAIIGMTLNHTAHVFGRGVLGAFYLPFFAAGGLTFPIMAFLLTEGYKKTSTVKKYALRLLIFGVISLVPFYLAFGFYMLNIMFTLFLGLVLLIAYDNIKKQPVLFVLILAAVIAISFYCDWNVLGISIIFLFHRWGGNPERNKLIKIAPPFLVIVIVMIINNLPRDNLFYFSVSLCVLPLLMLYNNERGAKGIVPKYFFYGYYPLHLTVLYFIRVHH